MRTLSESPSDPARLKRILFCNVALAVALFVGAGAVIAHFESYLGVAVFLIIYGTAFQCEFKDEVVPSLPRSGSFLLPDRLSKMFLLVFVIFWYWDLVFTGQLTKIIPLSVIWFVVPVVPGILLGRRDRRLWLFTQAAWLFIHRGRS